ncbi:MAG: hypothetical protein G01um101416_331 [Microgenomates group bacterium Gr01-1014_16]|nr:MAG: hypothetical protein G01um101416_331 [Microgenomates group bacterium Gr01-1014_16]
MIKISEAVLDLIQGDEVALEALRAGVLNLSAYARKIKTQIEKRLYKSVRSGSIVTALSRIATGIRDVQPLRPAVKINDLSIKARLFEVTYEKTQEIMDKVSLIEPKPGGNDFFTITQGLGEVTVIAPESNKEIILKHFGVKPKGQYDNLVAITVRFSELEYIEVPNMIYALVAALASKRINLIEIVSTFTEISFIVRQKDVDVAVDVLRNHF